MPGSPTTSLLAIGRATCTELRRDRIFLPAVCAGVLLLLIASLVSQGSIERADRIFFDLSGFALELLGGLSALVWGCGLLGLEAGSVSWQGCLVAPSGRVLWVWGRFGGLAACLLLLAAGVSVVGYGLTYLCAFSVASLPLLAFFVSHCLAWLVLASVALFFSAFCGKQTALFTTFCCWLAGLLSPLAARNLPSDVNAIVKLALSSVAQIWDLTRFHVDPLKADALAASPLLALTLYACGLVVCFTMACALIVKHKDLHA